MGSDFVWCLIECGCLGIAGEDLGREDEKVGFDGVRCRLLRKSLES